MEKNVPKEAKVTNLQTQKLTKKTNQLIEAKSTVLSGHIPTSTINLWVIHYANRSLCLQNFPTQIVDIDLLIFVTLISHVRQF